jgi:hypothetical protein
LGQRKHIRVMVALRSLFTHIGNGSHDGIHSPTIQMGNPKDQSGEVAEQHWVFWWLHYGKHERSVNSSVDSQPLVFSKRDFPVGSLAAGFPVSDTSTVLARKSNRYPNENRFVEWVVF